MLIGLKAKLLVKVPTTRLATLPTPAIVRLKNGSFQVLGGKNPSGLYRLVDPISHADQEVPLDLLVKEIGAKVLLVARKVGGAGANPKTFGFRWFLPTIWRYRRPLGHVLIASLFGRSDGGARARTRDHPRLPDRPGPVLGDRSGLRVRVHRGAVRLFAQTDADRAGDDSTLSDHRLRGPSGPARGRIDIIAVAQGKFQPTGRVKVIEPLETGKVAALHVFNGSRVAAKLVCT